VDLTGVISIVLEYLLSQIFFPFLWTRTLVFVLLGLWSRFSSYSYAWPAVLSAACRPWALARFHQNFMAPEGRQTPLSSDGILSNPPVGLLLCFRSLLTFILCCTYITLRHNYTDHCTERTRRKVGLVKHLLKHVVYRLDLWLWLLRFGTFMLDIWRVFRVHDVRKWQLPRV